MRRPLASLVADVSPPERNKYTAPLLLVHGLWSGSWVWHDVAGALAHRGWECWALELRGRIEGAASTRIGRVSLEDYVEDVRVAAQALWAPPVICGHDLGALLALLVAERIPPRALVCLAPLLPRGWSSNSAPPYPFMHLSAVFAQLWGRPLSPPRHRVACEFLFNTLSSTAQAQALSRLVPDSGTVVRTLTHTSLPLPELSGQFPTLILRGSEDRMSAHTAVRALASRLGVAYREYPGYGHWLPASESGSALVADVHRWLIKMIGESLLVPAEEEE
jgi:pimeloyl-ACP methyl ester carboxylesterase